MRQKYKAQYFNNIKFIQQGENGYYKNQRLQVSMHRYVWEYYNGKIPDDCEIHHIDGNKDNNDISNLQCVTVGEHREIHNRLLTDEQREWKRNNMNTVVHAKAIEWHKSEEGRQWHSKHAKKCAENWKPVNNICIQCGKEFVSKPKSKKFCSGACSQKYRRDNGLNNIKAICMICGKEFITDKYRPRKTCGKTCGNKLSWQLHPEKMGKKRGN